MSNPETAQAAEQAAVEEPAGIDPAAEQAHLAQHEQVLAEAEARRTADLQQSEAALVDQQARVAEQSAREHTGPALDLEIEL